MIYSTEIEQNILGTFLLDKKWYFETLGQVKPDDFFDPVHRHIFELMVSRFDKEQLVSPVTIKDAMSEHEGLKELGGPAYLVRMAGTAVSTHAIRDYCKELRTLTRRRNLSQLLQAMDKDLSEGVRGPEEVVGQLEASLIADDGESSDSVVSMMSAVAKAADLAAQAHQAEGVIGVPTGLADLDAMTGGFSAGELILLGGRPSMGKTAVALSMALSAARKGVGVAISSLEMTPDSLALRSVANEAATRGKGMAYTDAKRGTMTDQQAKDFFETTMDVGALPIEILPANMRDIGSIYAGVRKAGRILEGKGQPLGLIVVDYLQLISGQAKNRFEQIAEISIALKGLALKTGVPVLALSQLSRALESRDNKRPVLSDLRESGQLEQDADTVMFCFRHEYYLERDRPETDDPDFIHWQDALDASRNKLEIIVAKQRQGAVGTVNVGFNPATNYLWDTPQDYYMGATQ